MKVIFLDVDGVVNSTSFENEHPEQYVDPVRMSLLKRLILESGAELVLSSGWKIWFDENMQPTEKDAKRLADLFLENDIHVKMKTPDFSTEEIRKTRKYSLVKGQEILAWLHDNPQVTDYVILDDRLLTEEAIIEKQVHIDSYVGLTEDDVKKALHILRVNRCGIEQIEDQENKREISRKILEGLPDWFGIESSREEYIKDSEDQMFFVAIEDDIPVGFLCLNETGKDTLELTVMGVLPDRHRSGIGRKLFQIAKHRAKEMNYSFLQVKTVKMGKYEVYDRTNRFYLSLGFKELEVFPTLWDEHNPCQIYIMSI